MSHPSQSSDPRSLSLPIDCFKAAFKYQGTPTPPAHTHWHTPHTQTHNAHWHTHWLWHTSVLTHAHIHTHWHTQTHVHIIINLLELWHDDSCQYWIIHFIYFQSRFPLYVLLVCLVSTIHPDMEQITNHTATTVRSKSHCKTLLFFVF